MKTLDQIIIEFEGVWNFKFDELVAFEMTQPPKRLSFSKSEFQQRAKELGFVGRYRWGVEYKTDGKRPELADDVEINCYYDNNWEEAKVYHICWSSGGISYPVSKFKITDPRFKPADTSYLDKLERCGLEAPESLNHKCSSSDVQFKDDNDANWYCYETQKALQLPPVGVRCQYSLTNGSRFWDCEIISHHKMVIKCPHLANDSDEGLQIIYGEITFRPPDHDRKAKAERKRVVDAVMKEFPAANELILCDMCDKGFLCLPESKK
jgi:hypothetical protein